MVSTDQITSRVSFFGRLADEVTRGVVPSSGFSATIDGLGQDALHKDDGYFVFADVPPSATPYTIYIDGAAYQTRTFGAALPADTAVELTAGGEDELFVTVDSVSVLERRINFAAIAFVPTIDAGADVFGPGGLTSMLDEPLEGSAVDFAIVDDANGFAAGNVLRIVRSPRLLLRPGPSYTFPSDATVVAVKTIEDDPDDTPIEGVSVTIDRVNGQPLQTVTIGGVDLAHLPSESLIIGTTAALETLTTARGQAVYHFPSDTTVTELRVALAKSGYVATSATISVAATERMLETVTLQRA